jgi:uncharacterized protein YbcI
MRRPFRFRVKADRAFERTPKGRAGAALAVALALAVFAAPVPAGGQSGEPSGGQPSEPSGQASPNSGREQVAVRVGPRAITVAEVERRLSALSPAQADGLGDTPEAIRRKFVETVLVPELLLTVGAEQRGLSERPPHSMALARARAHAAERAVRQRLGLAVSIPQEDVVAYYEANRANFETKERISIFRILTKTREEAVAVLEAAQKDPTMPTWNALARDHSQDKATYLRGGNLGFVSAEGESNEPGLRVAQSVVKAAMSVRDGELAPAPVEEGNYWAVVWRRGTIAAAKRSVAEATPQIRDMLWKKRVEKANEDHIAELRKARLSELNEALLGTIEIAPNDGAIVPRRRPGQVPPFGAPTAPATTAAPKKDAGAGSSP